MDSMSFKSGHEFNLKHGLTENEVSNAVAEYKAKHKAEFEAKMFAELSDRTAKEAILADKFYKIGGKDSPSLAVQPEPTAKCSHQWQTHTQAQFLVPTSEVNALSNAEVNRIENQVAKVYCTHCLDVREI